MPERFDIYIVYKRRYINTLSFLSSIVLLAGVCRLSSSVTLPVVGLAGRARGRPTLHGGPVVLRAVRATLCFYFILRALPLDPSGVYRAALSPSFFFLFPCPFHSHIVCKRVESYVAYCVIRPPVTDAMWYGQRLIQFAV